MQYRSQNGSVHVIITVILVVVIIGLLGFVAWDKFLKPSTDSARQTNQEAATPTATPNEQVALNAQLSYINGPTTLQVKYPSSWKYNTEARTITSPDGELILSYRLEGFDGVGGTCVDASDNETYTLLSVNASQVTSVNDKTAFASYVSKQTLNTATYYGYGFGLFDNTNGVVTNAKGGDPYCSTFPVTSDLIRTGAEVPVATGTYMMPQFLVMNGRFVSLSKPGSEEMRDDVSDKDIRNAIASENAQIGQRIIESATLSRQ